MARGGFKLCAVLALSESEGACADLALLIFKLRCTNSELLCCAMLALSQGACADLALILRCTNSELLGCAVLAVLRCAALCCAALTRSCDDARWLQALRSGCACVVLARCFKLR